MKTMKCPSCGAPYNGRRCRSCYYEPFSEAVRPSRRGQTPVPRKGRPGFSLVRFLVLLTFLYTLMPMARNWGLKLEAVEEINRTPVREMVIPATDVLTLYQSEKIHIFTTAYDSPESLILYVQNDSDQDLLLYLDGLLVNGDPAKQELYCKASANTVVKNILRFDTGSESSDIQTISFRVCAYDEKNSLLFTTDSITLE